MSFFKRSTAPLAISFFGSLILSIVALYFNPVLARDSIFYLDISSRLVDEGFSNAVQHYGWPWMSVIVAAIHSMTGLSIIYTGLIITALLMATTCAALTRASQLLNPASAWWACLISLSIPAFNSYRDSVLREPGLWLSAALVMLSLALWHQKKQYRHLILGLIYIFIGSLFRLEAVFLLIPLATAVFWQLRSSLWEKRNSVIIILFVSIASFAALALAMTEFDNSRVQYYAELLNPEKITEQLSHNASVLSSTVLEKYSRKDAGAILIYGFSGLIITKFLFLSGPFLLVIMLVPSSFLKKAKHPLFAFVVTAFACYFIVLLVFSMQHSFIINRYIALLHVLITPLLASGALCLNRRYENLAALVVVASMLTGLSNVVSFSDKRTHYFSAGDWIKNNIPEDVHTYYSDGRVSFYANRRYLPPPYDGNTVMQQHFSSYDFFVIDNLIENTAAQQLIEEGKLEQMVKFDNGKRRHLFILRRIQ